MKKISSCVRPGVREVRASALRPVSALIRLDLPTLERPANAISVPRIGGSEAGEPAAATKLPVAGEQAPAGLDFAAGEFLGRHADLVAGSLDAAAPAARGLLTSAGRLFLGYFFFWKSRLMLPHVPFRLSNSSILAPCLRMMMLCCATDSELFQAQ